MLIQREKDKIVTLWDSETRVLIDIVQYADSLRDGMAIVRGINSITGKTCYGVIDINYNVIIPFAFKKVVPDYERKLFHCTMHAYRDMVPLSYRSKFPGTQIRSFNGNLLVLNGLELVEIPKIYCEARPFHEGRALVCKLAADEYFRQLSLNHDPHFRSWGYIDVNGNEIIKCQYSDSSDFHEGLARVEIEESRKKEGREEDNSHIIGGFIDKDGLMVIKKFYDDAGDFHEGLCWFRKGSTYDGSIGFMDRSGSVVIPPLFSFVTDFSDGIAYVKAKGEPRCEDNLPISKEGNLIWIIDDREIFLPSKYCWYRKLHEGYLAVRSSISGYYGVINQELQELIPCQYSSISVKDGLIGAYSYKKYNVPHFKYARYDYTYIDDYTLSCKRIFPSGYDNIANKYNFASCQPFNNGIAIVRKGGKWSLIDQEGRLILDAWFNFIFPLMDGYAIENGKWGKVSMEGELSMPFDFNSVRELEKGANDGVELVYASDSEMDYYSYSLDDDYSDDPMSAYDNPYYDSNLDMDQQSAEFWDEL